MSKFARNADATLLSITSIERPFSNFSFIKKEFPGLSSLRRTFSQIRQHEAKTMVFEELSESKDLKEENEDLLIRYPTYKKNKAYRLSFFQKRFKTVKGLISANNDDFIGYAIIKINHIPYENRTEPRIFESVILPSRYMNNFIRGEPEWTCKVYDKTFSIKGYLYAQQNNMTNVCAHVALRTAASIYKNGDMNYKEMNKIVGINHKKKVCGAQEKEGLNTDEMIRILESAGARCFVADYTKKSKDAIPFQKYIYGSIESGYPAIIIFGTTTPHSYHAIPVFGHTFNEDTWVPSAETSYFKVGKGTQYTPSDTWLSMFIAHDDNWGSNYCIPKEYLHTQPGSYECVAYIISTVPKEIQLSPIRAEVIGADYLFTILPQLPGASGAWGKRLALYAKNRRLVLRPILIESKDYVEHLEKVSDWGKNKVDKSFLTPLKNLRDEKLWMIEISIPELFSANRRKVGEVLIRAQRKTSSKRDMKSFLLARLPGSFALYLGGGSSNPKYVFISSNLNDHVELFDCEET